MKPKKKKIKIVKGWAWYWENSKEWYFENKRSRIQFLRAEGYELYKAELRVEI